jgi:hypothetical protein
MCHAAGSSVPGARSCLDFKCSDFFCNLELSMSGLRWLRNSKAALESDSITSARFGSGEAALAELDRNHPDCSAIS